MSHVCAATMAEICTCALLLSASTASRWAASRGASPSDSPCCSRPARAVAPPPGEEGGTPPLPPAPPPPASLRCSMEQKERPAAATTSAGPSAMALPAWPPAQDHQQQSVDQNPGDVQDLHTRVHIILRSYTYNDMQT